jgi:hypothetical protein
MRDAQTIVHDSVAAPLCRTVLDIDLRYVLDADTIVHDSFAAPLGSTVPPRIKTITAYLHIGTLLTEIALLTRFFQSQKGVFVAIISFGRPANDKVVLTLLDLTEIHKRSWSIAVTVSAPTPTFLLPAVRFTIAVYILQFDVVIDASVHGYVKSVD